ncbi:MAG: universal stress protein [Solirubrobacteraceae bacterium]|jgi:nucleotide-binding universal stress UspA family protein
MAESPSRPLFANILCAVDGTRASTAAVRMAVCLAGPRGHLTLLAVTAARGSGVQATAAIAPGRVAQVLARAKRVADEAGVPATTIVDPGHPPARVILERAADHDLLALGGPATSWLGGMLVGGVASEALSRFTTPTVFVRASFRGPLQGRRIVVASDGLEGSDEIVALAAALGVDQHAPVTLVHALGAESKMRPHAIQAQAEALSKAGASASLIVPGRAAPVIIAAVKSTGAAIVVIGSRRLGGLQAFNSVSRRVAHDSCSVLVLPPG